ncbi:MAG TPA: response regulator transcription factor [Gaiellaceae bacterium]|nr:response regulator transcription factor [Gaiellaceae bacterium]
MLRVVLGEDSYLAREGISRALEAAEGIELVASGGTLDEVLQAVDRLEPDVVLSDVRMPPNHTDEGIRLAIELRRSHPAIGVVILSQHADALYALALFDDGSDGRGYLLKDRVRDREELARALLEVARGGTVVDAKIVNELLAVRRQRETSGLETLTGREQEILALVAEGRSNGDIAETLVVTKRAVEGHINSIFSKLELGDPERVDRRVKAALLYLTEQRS